MKYIIIIFVTLSFIHSTDITKTAPLTATVIHVASDDVLNIRAKPNYHSKKLWFLKNGEIVSVEKCIKISSKSIWCKIKPFGFFEYKDQVFGRNQDSGWVNARYLNPSYNSYVSFELDDPQAEGVGCLYALDCKDGMCDVVDTDGVSQIERSEIEAFFPYGGYCDHIVIPGEKLQKYKDLRFLVLDIQKWLSLGYIAKIKQRIHPKNGLLMSYYTTFARKNQHFTADEFVRLYTSNKKLYWGESEGRGDRINLSLEEFFDKFSNINAAYEDSVKKVNLSRYDFPNPKGKVAYKIKSLHKDNSWVDMVVVLQKYKEHYYVVGILFDRWSI